MDKIKVQKIFHMIRFTVNISQKCVRLKVQRILYIAKLNFFNLFDSQIIVLIMTCIDSICVYNKSWNILNLTSYITMNYTKK